MRNAGNILHGPTKPACPRNAGASLTCVCVLCQALAFWARRPYNRYNWEPESRTGAPANHCDTSPTGLGLVTVRELASLLVWGGPVPEVAQWFVLGSYRTLIDQLYNCHKGLRSSAEVQLRNCPFL